MKITVPLYVHSNNRVFAVRPLFFAGPSVQAEKLERAMQKFTRELGELLQSAGKKWRHDELARWTFNPDLDFRRLDVAIELRRRVARCRFLFVTFEALSRRVAFAPALPELWFEVPRGQNVEDRAGEVFGKHFRALEREDEEHVVKPEDFMLKGTAWIHAHDVDIQPAPEMGDPADKKLLFLGPAERVDGEHELFRVGRCLDHLYPDGLDRVQEREHELAELTRLLQAPDRCPVLVLGPSLAGKTALLSEILYREVQARKDRHKVRNHTVLLSPQRLISGMSYVGQWENRLLAILKHARKKNHLLFFDDFLGLFHAGVTGQSDLSAAHVLKPYVERREVRLVAEMTPEAFRVLRERDRGFADLFHVLPLTKPTEDATLRILIAVQRRLEGLHRCRFAVDVLPGVIDLQRRYARHLAFPGKAAQFLRRLAVKHHDAAISREQALSESQMQSGLSLAFLDDKKKLERAAVLEPLRQRIIGQDAALAAATDIIGIAKARLNDPERPLGTFLFLGPTGVGKTQTAKALAAFLFGDEDRLLRFDMNEFVEPGSAARLVGTFLQPEGLLTSAVRRRPFAVVLLDEIEKAHPEVFDLLLQVLGEGRLTDAHGRLADFTNTIVILTSNLGVRESQGRLGFRPADHVDPAVFVGAAERFFRPEFFNRLDRIVPFGLLSRDDVARIAQGLMAEVLQREGLVRRKCLLQVEEEALARIVDAGYDPRFGARALKRAIERHLAGAVAERLAAGLPESFTHIHVHTAGRELAVHVQGLEQVPPSPPGPDLSDETAVLAKLRAVADRILGEAEPLRPRGEIVHGDPAHQGYFAIQEAVQQLRRHVRYQEDQHEEARQLRRHYAQTPGHFRPSNLTKKHEWHEAGRRAQILQEFAAAQDIQQFLRDLVSGLPGSASRDHARRHKSFGPALAVADAVRFAAYVQTVANGVASRVPGQALLSIRAFDALGAAWADHLIKQVYFALVPETFDLDVAELKGSGNDRQRFLLVRTLAATTLTALEEGTHLFCPEHGGLVPVQVLAWPVPDGVEPAAVVSAQQVEGGLRPVVRIYQGETRIVDLRSCEAATYLKEEWLLGALPLPPEFVESQE